MKVSQVNTGLRPRWLNIMKLVRLFRLSNDLGYHVQIRNSYTGFQCAVTDFVLSSAVLSIFLKSPDTFTIPYPHKRQANKLCSIIWMKASNYCLSLDKFIMVLTSIGKVLYCCSVTRRKDRSGDKMY